MKFTLLVVSVLFLSLTASFAILDHMEPCEGKDFRGDASYYQFCASAPAVLYDIACNQTLVRLAKAAVLDGYQPEPWRIFALWATTAGAAGLALGLAINVVSFGIAFAVTIARVLSEKLMLDEMRSARERLKETIDWANDQVARRDDLLDELNCLSTEVATLKEEQAAFLLDYDQREALLNAEREQLEAMREEIDRLRSL